MRKPNGPGPFVLVAACAALLIGCKEEFMDEPYGVLDLASVYDGGTTANPAAGIPELIPPKIGFVDDVQAEYYDFGAIPVKRNPLTGVPEAALVQPMYFFYNTAGQPLFSAPVRETREGTDWIKGGKAVLNPNPKDHCAGVAMEKQATDPCKKKNDVEKKRPYGARTRDHIVDKYRRVSDFQRPIIDVTPADKSTASSHYTGLWEVIEITVADGYEPDAIKHEATLDRAVASGKMRKRSTLKVINCPIVDERTVVARGVADRLTPHPRIELWYRRQLAYCYLANGWETLGNEAGELFFANSDAERVDTFDVGRLSVGEGTRAQMRLVVPISRAYVPAILTSDQSGVTPPAVVRVADNMLTRGLPKRFRNDPPGYSPVRWMFDFEVERDYTSGGLTAFDAVDPATLDTGGAVRNIPLRGLAAKCSYPEIPGRNQCGQLVENPADPTGPKVVDARGDQTCTAQGLECNPDTCFCDAPFVGYGQVCGPGIAQCNPAGDSFSPHGYTCLFPFGGYCYMKCQPTELNENANENMGKKATEFLDSRCKGIPGYRCLGYGGAGICLKLCDSNATDPNQCVGKTMVEMETKDINQGQICQDFGIEVCSWPDGFEPVE